MEGVNGEIIGRRTRKRVGKERIEIRENNEKEKW